MKLSVTEAAMVSPLFYCGMLILSAPIFTMSFEMPCNGSSSRACNGIAKELSANGDSISSPCPGYYPNDYCYEFQIPESGSKFNRITIKSFHLESWNDYLELNGPDHFIILTNTDGDIELIGYPRGIIRGKFKTNSMFNHSGFDMSASSISAMELNATLANHNSQLIASPIYLTSHDDNSQDRIDMVVVWMENGSDFSDAWKDYVGSFGSVEIVDISNNEFTVHCTGIVGFKATHIELFHHPPDDGNTPKFSNSITTPHFTNLTGGTTYYIRVTFRNKRNEIAFLLAKGSTHSESCENSGRCGPNAHCDKSDCVCNDGFKGTPDTGCIAFCKEWTTILPDGKTVTFPVSDVGTTVNAGPRCGSAHDGRYLASVMCKVTEDGVKFDNNTLSSLPCNVSVSDINISNDAKSLPVKAAELQIATSGNAVDSGEVEHVSKFIENVTAIAQTTRVYADVLQSVVSTVSNLIKSNSFILHANNATDIKKQLLKNINSLASLVKIPRNKVSRDIVTPSIIVEIGESDGLKDAVFHPVISKGQNNSTSRLVKISVPKSAIAKARKMTKNGKTRTSFFLHLNTTLFHTKEHANIGVVLSANLDDTERVDDFDGQVKLTFPENRTCGEKTSTSTFNRSISQFSCQYWDVTNNSWREDGCYYVLSNMNETVCACDHLTNYAVLLMNKELGPNIALDVWSKVGLCLSMAALVLTIIIHLMKQDVRKRRPTMILFHICVTLIISHAIFLAGISKIEKRPECTVVAALLQYFYLANWTWMGIYAFDMYRSFVLVFNTKHSRYISKLSIIGYGIPLLITALDAGIAVGYVDRRQRPVDVNAMEDGPSPRWRNCSYSESAYVAEHVCWIHQHSFYLGFVLPVTIILVFNIFVYIKVMQTIMGRQHSVASTRKDTGPKEYFFISVTLIASTGIPWAIGYLLLLSENEGFLTVVSWIFAIVNTLQGFIIFLSTCVRNENMRNIWLQPLLNLCAWKSDKELLKSTKSDEHQMIQKSSNDAYSSTQTATNTKFSSDVTHLPRNRGGYGQQNNT